MSEKKGRALSVDELLAGERVEELAVPELPKDGKPGIVYLRPPSAAAVLEFVEKAETPERHPALLRLMARSLVTPEGKPMFTEKNIDRIGEVSIGAFNRIATAVTAMAEAASGKAEEGNASSEAEDSASPTD